MYIVYFFSVSRWKKDCKKLAESARSMYVFCLELNSLDCIIQVDLITKRQPTLHINGINNLVVI